MKRRNRGGGFCGVGVGRFRAPPWTHPLGKGKRRERRNAKGGVVFGGVGEGGGISVSAQHQIDTLQHQIQLRGGES